MLTVRDLRKVFPVAHGDAEAGRSEVVAVDGVDLEVPSGAFASVLGPSGSGKTTLLRCIAGFERPERGTITLDDRELVSPTVFVRAHERGVGVLPQEGALFPHLTVAQNVGFGLSGSRGARRERIAELLDLVGLPGLGRRRPHQLSGGQQQRVALARALAPKPRLVLLDEPFSALDAQLRVDLRQEVRELLRGLGSTVVLITHDQDEAMSLADHLVVMRDGRVVDAGPPRSVYEHPADLELGRFLGDALLLPGRTDGIHDAAGRIVVDCALGRLPVGRHHGAPGPCRVLVRPEQIELVPHTGDAAVGGPAGAIGPVGTVTSEAYFGHDAILRVEVPDLDRPVAVRVHGRHGLPPGSRVRVTVSRAVDTYPER